MKDCTILKLGELNFSVTSERNSILHTGSPITGGKLCSKSQSASQSIYDLGCKLAIGHQGLNLDQFGRFGFYFLAFSVTKFSLETVMP